MPCSIILKSFTNHFNEIDDEIRAAIEKDKMDIARQHVHTLKGVSANISAMDLNAALISLENAFHNNAIDDYDTFLEKLASELNQVIKSVKLLEGKYLALKSSDQE